MSSCNVKQENTFFLSDQVLYQKKKFVLQKEGYRIGCLGKYDVRKHNDIFLGKISSNDKNIFLIPEFNNNNLFLNLKIKNKDKQVIATERIYIQSDPSLVLIDTTGNILLMDYNMPIPENWVCLIVMVRQNGIIAWNEKNGGKNKIFLKKNNRANEYVFKRIKIVEKGMLQRDDKGFNLLIEERDS